MSFLGMTPHISANISRNEKKEEVPKRTSNVNDFENKNDTHFDSCIHTISPILGFNFQDYLFSYGILDRIVKKVYNRTKDKIVDEDLKL